ncbi:MAG: hypothetical protein CMN76_02265 [Spirochaetaceae bacterium]|nr:hypothetical protein [Spirochaetaceae bacterium]|tara:strand:- start:1064 stop:2128 length:1065 start_codon:yes stop_codon:yes gene_type:complete
MNENDAPMTEPRAQALLEQYRKAIDVGTIVSKTDPYGKITYANDEFCRVAEYRRDELIGKPHNIVRHPDMPREAFKDFWHTIKKEKKPWRGIIKNRKKSGGYYWVNTTAIPILDGEGNIIEHIAMRSEITEVIENKQKVEKLLDSSKLFVPQAFLRNLDIADISDIQIGVARQLQLTVLFADLRSFTTITENMQPREILHDLNEFVAYMEPAIRNNEGFIDKFIGDAIMALFHSPEQAVQACLDMSEALERLNLSRSGTGKLPLRMGMGVHTGNLVLGTMGTENRLTTTVLGDTVNVASRLEGLTKRLNVPVAISDQVVQECTHMQGRFRRLARVRLKGRATPVVVHTISALNK